MAYTYPEWEKYERLVARMFANEASTDLCVTPNARIRGRISGVMRQIDVLIECRHDSDNTRRVIVDAKKRKRKVSVPNVEAFAGLMEDVGATHGYLICPVGYSKSAETRAQSKVSLRLVPLDHLEHFDPSTWPDCMNEKCRNGKIFWDGYPEFTIVARRVPGYVLLPTAQVEYHRYVHYVGKCDRCGRFHVMCTTCNEILQLDELDEEDTGQCCRCKTPWFWLASIEKDENNVRSAELHVVNVLKGTVTTVSRRSIE